MTLLTVRHGQASFGSADYDQLSANGHEQSRRLGAWLASHDMRFVSVVCGGLRRHHETLEGMTEAFRANGGDLPAPRIDPDLNEFDHRAIIAAFLEHQPDHPAIRVTNGGLSGSPREVFSLLHAALRTWVKGTLDADTESWTAFRERARRAFARLAEQSAFHEVLVISSGGVISQLAQQALGAADERAIELNLSLRNSALCEFHALSDGLRMGSWNALPHLADQRDLWTYF